MGDSLPANKIFIPVKGSPRIITNNMKDFDELIGCKISSGYTVDYCYFGYTLSIFVDDSGIYNNLPINPLASVLLKEKGPVFGNCILIDDYKELTIEDLSILIKISKLIPSQDWMPEPLLEQYDELKSQSKDDPFYQYMLSTYKSALKIGTKQERMRIWDQVKEYYVPPTDDE